MDAQSHQCGPRPFIAEFSFCFTTSSLVYDFVFGQYNCLLPRITICLASVMYPMHDVIWLLEMFDAHSCLRLFSNFFVVPFLNKCTRSHTF